MAERETLEGQNRRFPHGFSSRGWGEGTTVWMSQISRYQLTTDKNVLATTISITRKDCLKEEQNNPQPLGAFKQRLDVRDGLKQI